MAETYSLATPCRTLANHPGSIASVQLPDSLAKTGAQQMACQTGTAHLVKMPDGSMAFARIVPELSNFSTGDIVVQPV